MCSKLKQKLGDNANDFGSRRVVNTIRIEEIRVDDDRWHSLALFQAFQREEEYRRECDEKKPKKGKGQGIRLL
ncbi:hypothetical protein ANCDUO_09156, partial [Ancylostoma duodenale]